MIKFKDEKKLLACLCFIDTTNARKSAVIEYNLDDTPVKDLEKKYGISRQSIEYCHYRIIRYMSKLDKALEFLGVENDSINNKNN